MIVTETTLAALTLSTQYSVKWATLQHAPDSINVSAITNGLATVNFTDPVNDTITSEFIPATTAVWIIDLTQ